MQLKMHEKSFKTFDQASAFVDELCITSGGVAIFQWPNNSDWIVRWYNEARVTQEEIGTLTIRKGWKSRFWNWLTSL